MNALLSWQFAKPISTDNSRYTTIGCFKDQGSRAIPSLEGQDSILDGSYQARQDSIEKCYKAAKKRGFHIFAVQNGGWCASSATAGKTFNKYGKSTACKSDGKGGPWANQVYYITGEPKAKSVTQSSYSLETCEGVLKAIMTSLYSV